MLDLVGLGDLAAKRVAKLSGGQRRRVGLAQALIGDPRILVLDEPTTGLDPAQRADLRRTLSALGRPVRRTALHAPDRGRRRALRARGRARRRAVRFDGAVTDLVATAGGRVWLADEPGPATRWSAGAPAPAGTTSSAVRRRRARTRPSRPSRTPTC